jgi:hypothetical protein
MMPYLLVMVVAVPCSSCSLWLCLQTSESPSRGPRRVVELRHAPIDLSHVRSKVAVGAGRRAADGEESRLPQPLRCVV